MEIGNFCYTTMLCSSISNHSLLFRSVLPYCPHFLLLFESIAERTSELEDTIFVDGQLLAISLPLEVPKLRHTRSRSDLMGVVSCWWAWH